MAEGQPARLRTSDVFTTVGLPKHTYVKPTRFGEVVLDLVEPGKHLLIEGPSGVGKTCVVYKALEEEKLEAGKDFTYLSCRDPDAVGRVTQHLEAAERGEHEGHIFVLDDFHVLERIQRTRLGSRLKRLSDRVFHGKTAKFVLVGIPTAGESLLYEAKDLGPRIGIYKFQSVTDQEILQLIREGEAALNVEFGDRSAVVRESSGNFWLGQHFCRKLCTLAGVLERPEKKATVSVDMDSARKDLLGELHSKYKSTTTTLARGKKWRPGGNKPYLDILLAVAKCGRPVVTFDYIRAAVEKRRKAGVTSVRQRIPEVIHNPDKGIDLRKQLYFDASTGNFSIEDPLFLYYLKHLDEPQLRRDLGLSDRSATADFDFDIGFSFSGDVRLIVEEVNGQLKAEDAVTFYDADNQAFLLGKDLQQYFKEVYSAGCRFYLVFIDKTYGEKVWPTFEKDVLTQSGRREHIVPVVLEKGIASSLVGLGKTLGHIDLSTVYEAIRAKGTLGSEEIAIIRSRVTEHLLDKLNH